MCVGVTSGVVVGQVASLQELLGSEERWHFALSAYGVLVFVCFLPYLWFPESPKYLFIICGKREQARKGNFWLFFPTSGAFLILEEIFQLCSNYVVAMKSIAWMSNWKRCITKQRTNTRDVHCGQCYRIKHCCCHWCWWALYKAASSYQAWMQYFTILWLYSKMLAWMRHTLNGLI